MDKNYHLPELLAPVSSFAMCQAAVHNGADAIYVGVPHWNARGRAQDLSLHELREMIEFCRLRDVRVFFAMNVLVFEKELQDLPPYLMELVRLEPDAFITQDVGLARLIRQICPQQELHASTQMTLASAEAVQCVEDLDFRRVVLARELSLPEIRQIHDQVRLELEVFVHGALCVSYSGQCLTSESFGGRSANRGQCAQSCRLPYTLWVDGKKHDTRGRHFLFSPQDLCALDEVHELAQIGVHSLKIEGRLKSAEYVAAVTASYRSQLDRGSVLLSQRETLDALFSRGLFTGWLRGTDHQKLVNGFYSSHQGVQVGEVVRVERTGVRVRWLANAPACQAGDGVVFVQATTRQELGGRLYAVGKTDAFGTLLEFRHDLNLQEIENSWQVWRNDSPALESQVRRTFTDKANFRRVPVRAELEGIPGQSLRLRYQDAHGAVGEAQSPEPLLAAQKELDPAWMNDEVGALTATPYVLKNFINQVSGAFVPKPLLRKLRQEACAQIDVARLQWKILDIHNPQSYPSEKSHEQKPMLNLLVRHEKQLESLEKGMQLDAIYLDYDYGKRHETSLARIRQLGYRAGIATLRIHKSGENRYLENIAKMQPDQVLVRSLGALHWLREMGFDEKTLVGDHSLNVCNSMTAEWMRQKGLGQLHAAWDLNRQQLVDLLTQYGGSRFEAGLHFYVPTYHMEHCVFASMLSKGPRYPECKVPCMVYQLEVEDHKGEKHFLQSDAECRNTLYLGKPQSMVKLTPELLQLGVRRFRIEVLQESAQDVQKKVATYSALLEGHLDAEQAFLRLDVVEKYGITEGQLFNETRWVDRKQEKK